MYIRSTYIKQYISVWTVAVNDHTESTRLVIVVVDIAVFAGALRFCHYGRCLMELKQTHTTFFLYDWFFRVKILFGQFDGNWSIVPCRAMTHELYSSDLVWWTTSCASSYIQGRRLHSQVAFTRRLLPILLLFVVER